MADDLAAGAGCCHLPQALAGSVRINRPGGVGSIFLEIGMVDDRAAAGSDEMMFLLASQLT